MKQHEEQQQMMRNLRDFLLVYNSLTEDCFSHCVTNLNYRSLTPAEESCIDNCAGKLIQSNHRVMLSYVELMPEMVQRRVAEMQAKMEKQESGHTDAANTGS
uniref:mitochondrial import inner membrane translocase subunit Tim10 B n=1 Tax=Myxine glutinosa TaxID=7769 RepID=UPI00358F504D